MGSDTFMKIGRSRYPVQLYLKCLTKLDRCLAYHRLLQGTLAEETETGFLHNIEGSGDIEPDLLLLSIPYAATL